MQTITAEHGPFIQVWYNGHEVTELCTACRVSSKPDRLAVGWVDLLVPMANATHWWQLRLDDDKLPIIRRKWGLVSWLPTKGRRGVGN